MTSRDELYDVIEAQVTEDMDAGLSRQEHAVALVAVLEPLVAKREADVLRRVWASIEALPHSPADDWAKLAVGQYRARVLAAVDAAGETPDA